MASSIRPKLTIITSMSPQTSHTTSKLAPTPNSHPAAGSPKLPSISPHNHTPPPQPPLPQDQSPSSISSSNSIPTTSISAWLPCLQCTLLGLRCSFTASWQIRPRATPTSTHPLTQNERKRCNRCDREGDNMCLRQKSVDEDGDECRGGEGTELGLINLKWEERAEGLIAEKLWKNRWALPLGEGDPRRVRIVEMVRCRWGEFGNETD